MSLSKDALRASMWSSLTEIVLKLISPIVFLILTRILLPEDFGVVAVATNLLGFIYIIADLGLSKVIIQVNEKDNQLDTIYNVAFYTNVVIGVLLFILVFFGSSFISEIYNVPESKDVIKVMSFQILFFSFTSIQNAIKQKELSFKFLFYTRLVTVVVPAIISIPFAFMGFGYWAMVCGSTVGSLFSCVAIWIFSDWKPKIIWSNTLFKNLLSKSIWNSIEQIFIWFPMFLDTYLISNYISKKDLGLFTTSKTLFTTAIGVSLAAIIPVLYSTLSKIAFDRDDLFKMSLLKAQKIVFIIASSLGLGVYFFRDYIVQIVFNDRWENLNDIMGLMFLIMSFEYLFTILTEGIRAKGYFKEISLNTCMSILLTVIALRFGIKYGIVTYTVVRSFSLYFHIPGILYLVKTKLGINLTTMLRSNGKILIFSFAVLGVFVFIDWINLEYKLICSLVLFVFYLCSILFFEKDLLLDLKKKIFKND